MTKQNSKLSINLILSSSLLILLLAIWWFTKQINVADVADNSYLARVSCDLKTQPCVTKINETQILLAVQSQEIASFQPLPFIVTFKGIEASNVSIDFQGIEMFMGSNILPLKMSSANVFTGTHTLAGHTGYSMTWRAILKFDHKGTPQETWFEFPL
jgi:hypothetical protein